MTQLEWERYFFKRLAGTYLACRFTVMGGIIPGAFKGITNHRDLEFQLLGMRDYGWSIRHEVRKRLEEVRTARPARSRGECKDRCSGTVSSK